LPHAGRTVRTNRITRRSGFKHRPDELLRSFLNRAVSADTSVVDEDVNPAGPLLNPQHRTVGRDRIVDIKLNDLEW